MRSLIIFAFAAVMLNTQIASAQWDPEARRHLEEEIHMNEMRAHELEPIIARNTQARNDMGSDAAQLEGQARAMRDRANWYRQWAARPGVWHREHFEKTARELDEYAGRNDTLARNERDIAHSIEGMVQELSRARAWHLDVAHRMRDSLAWH